MMMIMDGSWMDEGENLPAIGSNASEAMSSEAIAASKDKDVEVREGTR